MLSAKIAPRATLKVYPGLGHGMCTINHEQINADLLSFINEQQSEQAAGSHN